MPAVFQSGPCGGSSGIAEYGIRWNILTFIETSFGLLYVACLIDGVLPPGHRQAVALLADRGAPIG